MTALDLNWVIPLSASHLQIILEEWVGHYNSGRPHMSLGPGIPDPPVNTAGSLRRRYRLNTGLVQARAVLGGLHHEYAFGTQQYDCEAFGDTNHQHFYRIVIQMYWQDHDPAQFHVRYGGDQAMIAIESGQLMRGVDCPIARSPWYEHGLNCIEMNCWRIGSYVKSSKRRNRSSP